MSEKPFWRKEQTFRLALAAGLLALPVLAKLPAPSDEAKAKAAEAAAKVQADLVEALARVVSSAGDDADKLDHIRSDVLKLLKDAQDRGFGAPVQQIDNTSSDGSAAPSVIKIVAAPISGPSE